MNHNYFDWVGVDGEVCSWTKRQWAGRWTLFREVYKRQSFSWRSWSIYWNLVVISNFAGTTNVCFFERLVWCHLEQSDWCGELTFRVMARQSLREKSGWLEMHVGAPCLNCGWFRFPKSLYVAFCAVCPLPNSNDRDLLWWDEPVVFFVCDCKRIKSGLHFISCFIFFGDLCESVFVY